MIKPAFYSLTNSRLQKLKARLDRPFGSVHLVFCGDFYQLPPIGSFIFQTPTQFENARDNNAIESMRGRHLLRTQLTDVVELTENLRQTADHRWAESLERWRINQPTHEDIESVNSRFVADLDPVLQRPPAHNIIAVCQNVHRETGIRYVEKRIYCATGSFSSADVDWKKRGILLVKARITQAEQHQKVRPQQENYIRGVN